MYTTAVVRTSLTLDQARDRLSALVRPRLSVRQWLDNRQTEAERAIPFVGRVRERDFKFSPVVSGRNSFVPVITGSIVDGANGAELRMVLRLAVPVMVFSLAMVSMIIKDAIREGPSSGPFLAIAAISAMTIGFFLQERRRALAVLLRTFATVQASDARQPG